MTEQQQTQTPFRTLAVHEANNNRGLADATVRRGSGSRRDTRRQHWNRWSDNAFGETGNEKWLLVTAAVIAAAFIGGYVAAVISRQSSSTQNTKTMTPQVRPISYQQAFDQIMGAAHLYSSAIDLADPSSGQYQAVEFLAKQRADQPELYLELRGRASLFQSQQHFLQRYVPAVLYFATQGDRWRNWRDDFLDDISINICTETSIELRCRKSSAFDQRVVWMEFGNDNLRGTLPPELGLLTDLEYLNVNSNQLTGTIPTQLGNLWSLTHLGLANNDLQGTLPTELERLTDLRTFYAQGNANLSGDIPQSFCVRPFEAFSVDCDQLNDCNVCEPPPVSSAPSAAPSVSLQPTQAIYFEYLDQVLQKAQLLSSEQALQDKDSPQFQAVDWLAQEQMAGIVAYDSNSHYDLIQRYVMAVLYFSTTLGRDWKESLNFLSTTHVCDWHQSADQQESFSSSSGGSGRLRYGVECYPNSKDIRLIDLTLNHLQGTIPRELGFLTTLQVLDLGLNALQSTIPSELGLLSTHLQVLDLRENKLTGSVPDALTSLTNLDTMLIYINQLTGSIPDGFCAFDWRSHSNSANAGRFDWSQNTGIWADCLNGSLSCSADCCERCYNRNGFFYQLCSVTAMC